MNSWHFFEINLIHFLQSFRSNFLDQFFFILNLFDTKYFSIILLSLLFIIYDWKWGLRLYYLLIISFLINSFFKYIFMFPRPFYLDTSLFVIDVKGYGFPSGAAQNSILYAGIVIKYLKNKKLAWIISAIFVFLIALSRIYLGLHFIYDIIGGWIVGIFVIYLFFFLCPKIERFLFSLNLMNRFLFSLIFPFFLFLFPKNKEINMLIVSSFSIGLGLCLSKAFNILLKPSKNFFEGCFRIIIFFTPLFFIYIFLEKYINIQIFMMGIFLTFLMPFIWKKFFLKIRFY